MPDRNTNAHIKLQMPAFVINIISFLIRYLILYPANYVSLPLQGFLLANILASLDLILEMTDTDDETAKYIKYTALPLIWTAVIFSGMMDISTSDLCAVDSEINPAHHYDDDTNLLTINKPDLTKYGIIAIGHIIIFQPVALTYSLGFSLGAMSWLKNKSSANQKLILGIFSFFGSVYYDLFTYKKIINHIYMLPFLGDSLKKIVSRKFFLCLAAIKRITVNECFRLIYALNGLAQLERDVPIANGLLDANGGYALVYITSILAIYMTGMSRTTQIWDHYLNDALFEVTAEELNSVAYIPFGSLFKLAIAAIQSLNIGWISSIAGGAPAAVIASLAYFIFTASTELWAYRRWEVIHNRRENHQRLEDFELMVDSPTRITFDDITKHFANNRSVNIAAYATVIGGGLTRFIALPNFMQVVLQDTLPEFGIAIALLPAYFLNIASFIGSEIMEAQISYYKDITKKLYPKLGGRWAVAIADNNLHLSQPKKERAKAALFTLGQIGVDFRTENLYKEGELEKTGALLNLAK